MTGTVELAGAAEAYGKAHVAIIPLRPRGKEPLTSRGLYDATADVEEIRKQWTARPGANIGMPTGQVSGRVVLDVDGDVGEASLDRLQREHGEVPETQQVLTGKGRHLHFAHPGGWVPCRAGIVPGLDVRGDGGYVVLPPSVHPSGRRYVWELTAGPEDIALAPLPAWLVQVIVGNRRRLSRDGAPLVIAAGARNQTLAQFGGLLRSYGLHADAIVDCLAAINRVHCAPPLETEEVSKIADSMARYTCGTLPARRERLASDPFEAAVARALR